MSALALLVGCQTGPSFDINRVQNLREGMPDSEVEAIMGAPYKKVQNPDGSETWIWDHVNGFTRSQCEIVLMDDKVYHLPQGIARTPEQRRAYALQSQADYTAKRDADAERHERERLREELLKLSISARRPFIGMTPGEATTIFGKPASVYVTVTANAAHFEQWTYTNTMNLYFHDHVLTSYQILGKP